jgi:hypothetical protein
MIVVFWMVTRCTSVARALATTAPPGRTTSIRRGAFGG